LNKVFSSFNKLYKEISLEFHLVNMFPNCFSFYIVNCKDANTKTTYYSKLNKIYEKSLLNSNIVLIIFNVSVKNKVTTSISHVQKGQNIIAKITHYAMNVTFTIIIDAIPAIRHIFNLSIHLFQLYFITMSHNLRVFFNRNFNNTISFWDCPSSDK